MSKTKKIKKNGKYNWFIVNESDEKANNYWARYEGPSYKEALMALSRIEVGTKETKNAYVLGIMLNKKEQELVGSELDDAISDACCDDNKSSIIIAKGEW